MQFEGKQPLGVVYNTSMTRPDAALALAMLYGYQGKREARLSAVSVNGAGLGAAIFCDIVQRFYANGREGNGNSVLMPGLAADGPLPPDPPMVRAVVANSTYIRSIRRVSDTSLPEAILRNGVIFNAEAVMILSAKATYLAKSLSLRGVIELYKARVKMLIVVDSGEPQDVPAMRKVLAEFESPIVFCPKELGDALPFPSAPWFHPHPIADACQSYPNPPSYDLAAVLHAVHPDKGFFHLSDPGAITVSDEGRMRFTPGTGRVRSLVPDPAKKDSILNTFVDIATARIPVPPPRKKT